MKVFIADYVPLKNKGEEAIIIGIAEFFILQFNECIELILFDDVDGVKKNGNITQIPVNYLFKELNVKSKNNISTKLRYFWRILSLYSYKSNSMLKRLYHEQVIRHFESSNIVIVGHNGFFIPESLAIIIAAHKFGKKVIIFGSGNPIPPAWKLFLKPIYRKALSKCAFCIYREEYVYNEMKKLFINNEKIIYAPDPAFLMNVDPEDIVISKLNELVRYSEIKSKQQLLISITVLETGIAFNSAYKKYQQSKEKKCNFHSIFIAQLLDIIIEKFNCYILFLPHSIENIPYKNDILAAQRIASKMRANTDNYCVLEEDLSPMMLKGIIQHSDFLIAERTHSMISAISVGTPFVGFTTHIDKRTHDIVGNMCNLECNLFNMEYPDIKYTNNKIENMISNISEEKKLAKQTKEMIQKRIYESYIKKNIYYESIITNT